MNAPGRIRQSLSPLAGTGDVITVTNGAAGGGQWFYRLIEQ